MLPPIKCSARAKLYKSELRINRDTTLNLGLLYDIRKYYILC